ncbi:MAG: Lrp/AsnC family transcriptional regulator [Candidatus Altiarchaeota archaeon]|nr:Lrp/AsnC family transcriptional regulator [Candidatus Altiarchaeota archaeon]
MELDATDWKLLELLSANPNMSQSMLSKELGITQPAICLRLKKLEEKNIIKRLSGFNPEKNKFSYILYEGKSELSKLRRHAHFIYGFEANGKVSAVFYGSCSDEAQKVVRDLLSGGKLTILKNLEGDFVIPVKSHKECCM